MKVTPAKASTVPIASRGAMRRPLNARSSRMINTGETE